MAEPLFHLTTAAAWTAARAAGEVVPAAFATEGFVHCATAAQIEGVFHRYYEDLEHPVLLRVDPERLGGAEIRWEGDPEPFPHVYAPLPVGSVAAVAAPWRPGTPLP